MNSKKIITLIFMLTLFIGTALLINYCLKINTLLNTNSFSTSLSEQYNVLQKHTNIASIIIFIVLLSIGFLNYYLFGKTNYIAIANLLYIPITLYNYATLNSKFFTIQGIIPRESSAYLLLLFIGIFYIVGAILISSIGLFTIKNLIKRTEASTHFRKRK